MSQNPFGPPATFDPHSQQAGSTPPKTSALAITALIFSLLFCIPGAGVIGVILGIIGIITIGASQGRVKGRGMAVTSVIVGLIASIVWIGGCALVFKSGMAQRTQIATPSYGAFTAMDAGDITQIRALLSKPVSEALTNDEIMAFHDEVQAKLGTFNGEPMGTSSLQALNFMDMSLQQSMTTSGVKGAFPIPASFSNNVTMIYFASDTIMGPQDYLFGSPSFKGSVVDIAVVVPGQKPIRLSEFKGRGDKKPDDKGTPRNGG